ncbi:hypothetical protein [Parabacteroides sp. ZJ-118]|uniref:hypothetical protein n=1 Tax=Parabacteroides sp. ZJ-118 TaxID=2709398 RepID=UPI0013EAF38B|nr:hypothetical protein [Parabacteroides sp. ZJ-118]
MGNPLIAKKDKYNIRRLYTLSLLLVLPSFLDFSKSLIGENVIFSIVTYIIVGGYAYGFAVRKIKPKDIVPIIILGFLILLSYSINGNTEYYLDKSFLLASFFFFPIASLVVFKINDWSNFFEIFSPFAKIGIVFGSIVIVRGHSSMDLTDSFNYMEFSYAMSPLVIAMYVVLRKRFSVVNLAFFFAGLVTMVSFGARATILFTIAFILYYELIYNSKNAIIFIIASILFLLIYINLDSIMEYMATLPIFRDSRFITLYLKGNLVESSARDAIYEACQSRICSMGVEVSGFFGNRTFVLGQAYPHNFVYEIMMDFGWLFGPLILLWLAYLIINAYFINGYYLITAFAFLSLFARYLISGSYIIEGKFWIFIFMMLSIKHFCKINNN